jgi:hypothetical protein
VGAARDAKGIPSFQWQQQTPPIPSASPHHLSLPGEGAGPSQGWSALSASCCAVLQGLASEARDQGLSRGRVNRIELAQDERPRQSTAEVAIEHSLRLPGRGALSQIPNELNGFWTRQELRLEYVLGKPR